MEKKISQKSFIETALAKSMQPIAGSETEAREKNGEYEHRTYSAKYKYVETGWRSDIGFYTIERE